MGLFDVDDFFIREEELLGADDYADIECNDCVGCENSCCREISGAITLDSFDMNLLKEGLGKSFDELVGEGLVSIVPSMGVPLPIFANKKDKKECIFLKDDGRCSIHPYRAGICRMYPVARLWRGDNTFAYYLQRGECTHRSTAKTKISDWLGYTDTEAYENEIRAYHARLKKYREDYFKDADPEAREKVKEAFFDENFR